MDALNRIIGSQKVILGAVAGFSNLAANFSGQDPTEGVMLIVNGIFGMLIGAQTLLDLRWGSKSDGTGS